MTRPDTQRAGFVAIIGSPNAGKSTLANALTGRKVSIVTHKVQTTRFPVRAVIEQGDTQIVLVDTPGVFEPKQKLDRAMQRSVRDSVADADAVLHVLDVKQWKRGGADTQQSVTACLRDVEIPVVLALNKIDVLADKAALLPVAEQAAQTRVYRQVLMISALKGKGLSALSECLAKFMPLGPWLYPAGGDAGSVEEQARLAAEITREKLMLRLHQEVPYTLAVIPESWEQGKDGSVCVRQTVLVREARHRGMVIGHQGQKLAAIGKAARSELETMLGRKVHLFLHVKLAGYRDETMTAYRQFGLTID